MLGDLGDADVEGGGKRDGAVAVVGRERRLLFLEVAAERGDVGPWWPAPAASAAARGSSSERTSKTWRASSTVGWATCAPRLGSITTTRSWASACKRGADDGPARAEGGADLVLGQPRPGRQAMIEDGGEQSGVDGANPLASERRSAAPPRSAACARCPLPGCSRRFPARLPEPS